MRVSALLLTVFCLIAASGFSQRPSNKAMRSRSGNGPAVAAQKRASIGTRSQPRPSARVQPRTQHRATPRVQQRSTPRVQHRSTPRVLPRSTPRVQSRPQTRTTPRVQSRPSNRVNPNVRPRSYSSQSQGRRQPATTRSGGSFAQRNTRPSASVNRSGNTRLRTPTPTTRRGNNGASFNNGGVRPGAQPRVQTRPNYARPRTINGRPSYNSGVGTSTVRGNGTRPTGRPGNDTNDGNNNGNNGNNNDRGKITICHIPPGNPANAHTITIAQAAWPAHQAHGDQQGACPGGGNGGPKVTGDPVTASGKPKAKPTWTTATGGQTKLRPKPKATVVGGGTPRPRPTGTINTVPRPRNNGCPNTQPVVRNNYCGGSLYTYTASCGAPTGYWYGGINNYYCGSSHCGGMCGATTGWVLSVRCPIPFGGFFFYRDYTRECPGFEVYYHRYRNFTRTYGNYRVRIIHEGTGAYHTRIEYERVRVRSGWWSSRWQWVEIGREILYHGPDCGVCYGDWF